MVRVPPKLTVPQRRAGRDAWEVRPDRTQQRLRWHLFQLDPTYLVPLRMLGRASHLERVSRWLARQEQELQLRLARELVTSCRILNRAIAELDQQLEQRVTDNAPGLLELPGCAAVTAAKLLAEIGPIDRFQSDAQPARHGGVAPLEASSGRTQRHRLDRGGNRQRAGDDGTDNRCGRVVGPTPAPLEGLQSGRDGR